MIDMTMWKKEHFQSEPAKPGSLHRDCSAALVREQDAANELYEAACCLMRYKEADQWHNLENAAHRFNAARQARINDEIMRQNAEPSNRTSK